MYFHVYFQNLVSEPVFLSATGTTLRAIGIGLPGEFVMHHACNCV